MTDTETAAPPITFFWRSRAGRFVMLLLIALVLSLPLLMIGIISDSRQSASVQAAAEVGGIWGGAQTLAGPMLVIPFEREESRRMEGTGERAADTVIRRIRREVVILPRALDIDGTAASETRHRGIYDITVYSADLTLAGSFEGMLGADGLGAVLTASDEILWDQAYLAVSVTDPRAFRENIMLDWGGASIPFEPGARVAGQPGVHAPLGDPRAASGDFSFTLALNGSRSLRFVPLGVQTAARLGADWPHPSFDGAFLPDEHSVTDAGFEAQWRIPYLTRSLPQRFVEGEGASVSAAAYESAFGVTFYRPLDIYQKMDRAMKYAVLFVGLTLLTVFLIEIAGARPAHAVQYLMIGLAQCVFFLLLLGLAEHTGFAAAYLTGAAATVALITVYAFAALRLGRAGWTVLALLTVLYAFLYLLLSLQDYALLIGAVASFLALAGTMWATRHVDWRAAGDEAAE